jgi:hypothetical protein
MLRAHGEEGVSFSDLTVLVDAQELGEKIVSVVGANGTRCISTFERSKAKSRSKKLAFFMGDARIKVTTIHSFKGWETRALLICIQRAKNQRDLALLYSGLTRLKRHSSGSFLTVVCAEEDLANFGKGWPDFAQKENYRSHLQY